MSIVTAFASHLSLAVAGSATLAEPFTAWSATEQIARAGVSQLEKLAPDLGEAPRSDNLAPASRPSNLLEESGDYVSRFPIVGEGSGLTLALRGNAWLGPKENSITISWRGLALLTAAGVVGSGLFLRFGGPLREWVLQNRQKADAENLRQLLRQLPESIPATARNMKIINFVRGRDVLSLNVCLSVLKFELSRAALHSLYMTVREVHDTALSDEHLTEMEAHLGDILYDLSLRPQLMKTRPGELG